MEKKRKELAGSGAAGIHYFNSTRGKIHHLWMSVLMVNAVNLSCILSVCCIDRQNWVLMLKNLLFFFFLAPSIHMFTDIVGVKEVQKAI